MLLHVCEGLRGILVQTLRRLSGTCGGFSHGSMLGSLRLLSRTAVRKVSKLTYTPSVLTII